MEKTDIILAGGIVLACIFLGLCVLLKPKNRKYVYIVGVIVNLLMYVHCRNNEFLLCGIAGGLIIGLIPIFGNKRKYNIALGELGGKGNLTIACILFCTTIFMTIAVAFPWIEINW